jgi:hypothetical protein
MPAEMMLYQPILAGESYNLEAQYYGGNEEELCVRTAISPNQFAGGD